MNIINITSFLVYPAKNLDDRPESIGAPIPLEGNLYAMLSDVFLRSDRECDIPIRFLPDEDGSQNSEVRNMIREFIGNPDLENGIVLANRLRNFTTIKSGLGLLFLMLGYDEDNDRWKIVVSRFPADQGILAEAGDDGLQIEFIERVFLKSATTYKAALYQDSSLEAGFWSGHAVDKQTLSRLMVANYWIHDFLASDFKTTSKAGTRRFAVAIRDASGQAPSIEVQRELVGLRMLAGGLSGQLISIQSVMDNFGLSDEALELISTQLKHGGLLTDQFVLDYDEFTRYAAFTSVEFHNGGLLLAPSDSFNDIFRRETVDQNADIYQYSIEGRIVDERVRGRK